MTSIISFPGAAQSTHTEVGGKGYSLIRMVEAGLPVPPGAVLTTEFFKPWFDEIKASATWSALALATPDKWATLCNELKELCLALPLTGTQRQALDGLCKPLSMLGDNLRFAVRSSSPEEDLSSASFAGGYETRLGVQLTDLADAVRFCFASSLDERVLIYKKEQGFDVLSPRIAVVVQQQIDSEVAGVGFSLNPLTNDYDEAVIDANWGLGESVVAGIASPDHYIVDKFSRQIIEKKRGAKKVSIRLGSDGGTIERQDSRSTELTLSDGQLGELTEMICQIEGLYEKPMDIEWAYSDGRLYVLQARPITKYVPLALEMVTKPGERRRLYVDAALSKGMTLNVPISPFGLSWMEDLMISFFEQIPLDTSPMKGLVFAAGGRMYMNLSNLMWLMNPKALSKSSTANDALLAEILANIDEKKYCPAARPPWIRLRMVWLIPRMLWWLRGFFKNMLYAILSPERAYQTYQRRVTVCEEKLSEKINFNLPLKEFLQTYFAPVVRDMFNVTMAALTASLVAMGTVDCVLGKKLAQEKSLVDKLKRGVTGNVVVEMGIMLFRLAKLLNRSDLSDLNRLVDRIESRQMSATFLNEWDNFLSRYGCRGPMEMDPARPRYGDDPRIALRQMSFMSVDDEDFNPEVVHRRQVEDRRRAYEALMSRSGWFRRILLQRIHRVLELFAGSRDTPKHHIVLFNYALRKRALIEGRHLVREGRLDAAEDVFDLTLDDLGAAANNPSMNLRKIPEFPNVIDSRGRILRPPPRKEKTGEMSGMAVSPDVVTGIVKVLRNPYEKSINKGDVLVAYTADPGWTPLFVNAAAVLLEVGGVLQHGAVIAREYGKPCVVGIDGLMKKLCDGQRVEVDGTAGVIRLLS